MIVASVGFVIILCSLVGLGLECFVLCLCGGCLLVGFLFFCG